MQILAVADIHGSQYRLNSVLDNISQYSPDIVVICGDITQFGPGEVAINFLNQIPIETLAIPGNIDTSEVGPAIDKSKAENIHLKKVVKNGFSFVGIGGESIPSNCMITDEDEEKIVHEIINKKTILVTHVPPYKLQDKVYIGYHIGSKELKDIVEKNKPRLVLCGHVHEDPGMTTFEDSIIVNCSMGKRTQGTLIDINTKITVKILD
jgi:Icc-related predicted phosphoesterase